MDPANMKKHEIEVDPTRRIKEVRVKSRQIGGLFYVKGLQFLDSDDESLLLFETSTEKSGDWVIQELKSEERITGVHG